MKKLSILSVLLVALSTLSTTAFAEPKALPAGTMVNAVCVGSTATVTVSGVAVESMEYYYYFKPLDRVGAGNVYSFNLDDGRRFNFTFAGGYYAGLSAEMSKRYGYPASFLGQNIDIDNSNPLGAAFVITCPSVR